MTSPAKMLAAALVLALAVCSTALAQTPPPPAPPPPAVNPVPLASPVPEPVFRAVVGRKVELRLLDGQIATGQLLALEPENAVLALPDGRVMAIARPQVLEVRLSAMTAPATPSAPVRPSAVVVDLPRAPKAPDIERVNNRHFGIQFGLAPGILAFDLAYGSFYGFLSGSLALPMYSAGTGNSIGGVTLAPGLTFKVSDDHSWYFDLFVHATLGYYGHGGGSYYYYEPAWTSVDGSVGIGMGFHYTAASGFTVGFKLPITGFAFGQDVSDLKSAGGYYYLNALLSFPAATLGYRF